MSDPMDVPYSGYGDMREHVTSMYVIWYLYVEGTMYGTAGYWITVDPGIPRSSEWRYP